jgi:hypothetical protein
MLHENEAVIRKLPLSLLANKPYCKFCAVGHLPYKMKRQTIHHFPCLGKIVVCEAAELKPSVS